MQGPWGRDGDHLLMLYTGGTTGMPKGVMWRQDDLFRNLAGRSTSAYPRRPRRLRPRRGAAWPAPGFVGLPACPLMHGTGCFTQLILLCGRRRRPCSPRPAPSTSSSCSTLVEQEKVNQLVIVGDAFAKPILRELDANPGRWDLSSMFMIASSGVMFSEESKQGLLGHNPSMMIIDAFSSSEAVGMGQSISTAGGTSNTAKFVLGENTKVITEDGRLVEPGSGEIGPGRRRRLPADRVLQGPGEDRRHVHHLRGPALLLPGRLGHGRGGRLLTLLGRGSVCINTGGEKVFPEEVEEVAEDPPRACADAVAVGVPDEKFGEAITRRRRGRARRRARPPPSSSPTSRSKLASYKAPKHVVPVDTIGRAPNGKVDYKRLKAYATETSSAPPDRAGAAPIRRDVSGGERRVPVAAVSGRALSSDGSSTGARRQATPR